MHDDDPFRAFLEPHDFQAGDRVEVVEGTDCWRYGLRRGIVLGTHKTVREILAEAGGGRTDAVDARAAERGVTAAWEWTANKPMIEVVFEEVEPWSAAADMPPPRRCFPCLPVELIRTGTIADG